MGYGPKIKNREYLYDSASGITRADHRSASGCLRRAFAHEVLNIREERSKSMDLGSKTHASIEKHLSGEQGMLNRIALSGSEYIPAPNDKLVFEKEIKGEFSLSGVGIVGKIDLVTGPGLDFINPNKEVSGMPENTVEVLDWKTSSNVAKYSKNSAQLKEDNQMMIYANWAISKLKADRVIVSHVVFQTKGRPFAKKTSVIVDRDHVLRQKQRLDKIVSDKKKYLKIGFPQDIPRNFNACNAYFKPCPVMNTAYCRQTLNQLMKD